MKLLGLDTSTKNFSIAVSDGAKIIKSKNMVCDKILSDSIVPNIKKILKSCKMELEHLDGFAVGLGPGSFTSLRVGLSTIKALAFATKRAVVGISSLDIIAADPRLSENICIICDAKRDLVYCAFYKKVNGKLKRKNKYLLTSIDDVISRSEDNMIFAGDGVTVYKEALRKNNRMAYLDENRSFPKAENLIPLALERFKKKKIDNIKKLVPLYLYPKDCQVRR